MRITDSMQTDFWQNAVGNSLNNLNTVQQQIATGKQINQPSDNPAGAAEAMAIGSSMVENTQYQTNVTSAQSFLNVSSGALQSVSNILLSARQLASEGANTTDTSTYQGLISQVDALTTQLVNVANTKNGDQYVFSGTNTLTPPYTQYATPSTAPAPAEDTSTPGTFTQGTTYYVGYSYTYANGGVSPVSPGGTVTPAGATSSIDVNGVPALPAGATGVNVYIGTSATPSTWQLAGTSATNTPITISNPPSVSAPTAPVSPVYAGNTASINSNIGPNSTIQLNTPGSTVFDPIFSTLADLRQNLVNASNGVSGAITAVSADLTKIDANTTTVSTINASVGAKVNMLSTTASNLTSQSTQYQQSLSNIQDVDLATAYVQLQSDQNVYQASLDATAKAFQYSLVNYLS